MKRYEYLINGKQFVVEILAFNGQQADVRVNGTEYRVEVPGTAPEKMASIQAGSPPPLASSTPISQSPPRSFTPEKPAPAPAERLPPPQQPAVATSEEVVTAPMPGIILSILVDEGQIVSAGDPLLVLEAMKMENEIHAPRSGVVKKILVRQGSDVRQGTPLIELA